MWGSLRLRESVAGSDFYMNEWIMEWICKNTNTYCKNVYLYLTHSILYISYIDK